MQFSKDEPLLGYEACGQRITDARNEKGLSQAKLAELVDCTSKYLSEMENGAKPSLDMLTKLHLILDKSYDYFMADTPYATSDYVINVEIADKLSKCNAYSLHLVNDFLDNVLASQGRLLMYAQRIIEEDKKK